ncbi:3-oxoacyl-ACP synthase [Streptomyces sp. SID8379]|uniref:ketoacyl-ACP synthase III family protein n=1 Tax=unclassified Streptomyces TaxID=2593676 RepID=UPI0003A117AD|nr:MULTISPECIES: ketoacyl-ACP synthase III family protein [unclassified Streptomyces]MYW65854.1 3-oxoacyl-ACP synthase [Streptomyces sp. SID8379]
MGSDGIYLSGTGSWLPPRLTTAEAARRGLCGVAELAPTKIESATVSDDVPAPEMAARAVAEAMRHSGALPHEIDLLLYANVWYQGHDMWAPASYVQRVALGNDCPAVEIRQLSNGGMAALALASDRLRAASSRAAAVVAAGDRFAAPAFDRWHSDPGTVFADGAAAWVLDNQDGFARLHPVSVVSDPELEGMHRGDDPFGDAPGALRPTVELRAGQRAFLSRTGMASTIARSQAGQQRALKQALADAEAELGEIDHFVLPHFGHRRLAANFLTKLRVDEARTTWDWARTVGHLGAGDQLAGLDRLVRTGRLGAGDRVLLMGVGAGFSWSSAVVDILRPPRPATAPHSDERTTSS